MSKVICDICGTTYPETAEQCPICGCSRDLGAQLMEDDLLLEEQRGPSRSSHTKGGHFSSSNVRKRNKIANPYQPVMPEEDEDEEEAVIPYHKKKSGESNGVLVTLLVIVILALLAVTGFIFVKYFLPNIHSGEAQQDSTHQSEEETRASETESEETPVPTVPCESIELLSDASVELGELGQYHLVNAKILPEDTTDTVSYVSSDEAIVTVNSEGRIEAIGEGEAVVTVICGSQQVECTVVVRIQEEETTEEATEEPTEEPTEETTGPITCTVTANLLYYRDKPGTNSVILGFYGKNEVIEVLETTDVDGIAWGRTDQGWVCMTYVEQN